MMLIIITTIVCLIATVLMHELAHVYTLRIHGKKARLAWGPKGLIVKGDYTNLTKKQKFYVYANGVYMGLIPIIISAFAVHLVYLLYIIPYAMLSRSDIHNMIKYSSSPSETSGKGN